MASTLLRPEVIERATRLLRPDPHRTDPAQWAAEIVGDRWWSVQRRIGDAVVKHRRVAVPSGHGVGKSFVAAGLAAWWVTVHPPGTARVITTAPTWAQVSSVLWQEILLLRQRAAENGHPLPGSVTLDARWRIGDLEVAVGRKPADSNPAGFQGVRARHTLIILDEAGGVAHPIWTAAGTLMTGSGARILAIGNPDDPTGHFARVCKGADPETGGMSDEGWFVIPISVLASPGFTGEPVPPELLESLPGPEWLSEKIAEYGGTETPLYKAKILGQFPDEAAGGVIPWAYLVQCTRMDRDGTTPTPLRTPVELGVDPAYSNGGDTSVIRERRGPLVGRVWRHQVRPDDLAPLIVRAIRETGATRVKVDTSGGAAFLAADLRARARNGEHNAVVVDVNFGAAASDPARYANARAELWHRGALLAHEQGWILTPGPDGEGADDRTLADLAAPRMVTGAGGRIQIEAKTEVRKRLGRSPDDGDALLLAFYEPAGTSTPTPTGGAWRPGKRSHRTR